MDRRTFLRAVAAVPVATVVPIQHLITPPLSPLDRVKRQMAQAMAALSAQLDQAVWHRAGDVFTVDAYMPLRQRTIRGLDVSIVRASVENG